LTKISDKSKGKEVKEKVKSKDKTKNKTTDKSKSKTKAKTIEKAKDKTTDKSKDKTEVKTKGKTKDKTKVKSIDKTKDKETLLNSINKKYFLIIPIIIIVCIAGFILLSTTPETAKAQLVIESGTVEVQHLGSWAGGTNNMELYQSDSIRTGINSSASVILFKGSIIRLDENTEITLKEIIQEEQTNIIIQQDAGRTWNTVQKISGIDNYEVQTPTTVASVRGTSFDVDVNESGLTVVSVVKGIVNVSITENGTEYNVQLNENWSITVESKKSNPKKPIEVDEWIEDNLLKDDSFVGELKTVIYSRLEPYIDELKSLYGMTNEEIEVLIEGFIRGDFSIPAETPEEYKILFDLS
jgi:hypothetical protein